MRSRFAFYIPILAVVAHEAGRNSLAEPTVAGNFCDSLALRNMCCHHSQAWNVKDALHPDVGCPVTIDAKLDNEKCVAGVQFVPGSDTLFCFDGRNQNRLAGVSAGAKQDEQKSKHHFPQNPSLRRLFQQGSPPHRKIISLQVSSEWSLRLGRRARQMRSTRAELRRAGSLRSSGSDGHSNPCASKSMLSRPVTNCWRATETGSAPTLPTDRTRPQVYGRRGASIPDIL